MLMHVIISASFEVLLVSGRRGDEFKELDQVIESRHRRLSSERLLLVSVWTNTLKSKLDNFIGLHTGLSAETLLYMFVLCTRIDFVSFDNWQGLVCTPIFLRL